MFAINAVMKPKITLLGTALWLGTSFSCGLALASSMPNSPSQPAPPTTAVDPPPAVSQSRVSPPVPPLPTVLPPPTPPGMDGLVGLHPEPMDDIGVGHLRPENLTFLEGPDGVDSHYLGANWLRAAAIPIYIEPDGTHWGWIINGWLVPNGQEPIALGSDASFSMLRTYYSLYSFPVTQIQDDGWFQFQYTPAGRAWAHVDHLDLGRVDLTVETWENRFLETGWVEFRRHGLSQALSASPNNPQSTILGLIGPDSFIEPIAFDGDWMQVRVTQPTNGCQFLPGAITQEGWMRWRSEDRQPLVWFPPEEC